MSARRWHGWALLNYEGELVRFQSHCPPGEEIALVNEMGWRFIRADLNEAASLDPPIPSNGEGRMRVTLNGIKRRGLVNWRARERWLGRTVYIWSDEHGAWWRAGYSGYSTCLISAGRYLFQDAYEATKHCGPEKRIVFVASP